MDLKRGILGAVMGGATGLQAGKMAEFESEKKSILAAMQALRDENLARFKHGLDLERDEQGHRQRLEEQEKGHGFNLEKDEKQHGFNLEKDKIKHGYDLEKDEKQHAQRLKEQEAERQAALAKAGTKGGAGGSGDMDSLDAQRIVGIGNEIEANYIKKGKDVPEWLLNDFNAVRASHGLPTVTQSTVKKFFIDGRKLDLDDGANPKGAGLLSDAISKAKGGGGTNLADVIAQVKKERGETKQEKPKEKPAAEKKSGNDAWAMSTASMNSRQSKKSLDQKIQQLKAEAAQAEKDEAALPRAEAARRRVARAKEIRQLTEEANKL